MNVDLNKKLTQAKFAQMIGVTQPVVSGLIARGVLMPGDTAGNWLLAYCGNLRDVAAGRSQSGEGGLNLSDERARLAAAQADKVEMENEVMRGELAPVSVLERVLSHAANKVVALLDTLPGAIKRRVPALTESDVGFVRREIARMRNEIADLTLEDVEDEVDEAE